VWLMCVLYVCIVRCRRGVWAAWVVVAAGAAVDVDVAARGAASPAMRMSQSLSQRATLKQVGCRKQEDVQCVVARCGAEHTGFAGCRSHSRIFVLTYL
jgi:hypothetical protein